MKTIDVIVAPDGSSRVQTNGFTGSQCKEASRFLEQALGTVQSEQLTADFYRTQSTETQQARQQP
ncbi:MAG TPA: hypothetical protein DDZ51_18750 [Planctomycetaceae bacterium]|nr:hypothetical protein [Planctomycetaceae bacterium]